MSEAEKQNVEFDEAVGIVVDFTPAVMDGIKAKKHTDMIVRLGSEEYRMTLGEFVSKIRRPLGGN